MVGNNKWHFLRDISKTYSPDILEALYGSPMRFTDLKKICRSQKTLTQRIHSLEDCGAITTEVKKERKQRVQVLYTLTQKGRTAIELAQGLAKLQ